MIYIRQELLKPVELPQYVSLVFPKARITLSSFRLFLLGKSASLDRKIHLFFPFLDRCDHVVYLHYVIEATYSYESM